nr:hypothetical protein [Tanacetum cinerariifolium]
FQCQPMNQNFYEPNLCYNSISFDFGQFQPPQFPVIHQPPQETSVEILKDHENELAEYINTPSWNRPAFYNYDDDDDDDEDYTIAITPVLSTKEPVDSLIMEDEHLDTIPIMKSDKVIKSSFEDLVPIPSESEGIPDNMCDVPFRDNSLPLDILKDQFKGFSDFNDDSTSIDDDYFSIDDIVYVEASPPHLLIAKIESLNDDPNPNRVLKSPSSFPIPGELTSVVMEDILGEPRVHVPNVLLTHPTLYLDSNFTLSDISLPESEIFRFDIKEKNSGSTTIHADISLSDLECFYFKSEPDPRDLTSIIDPEIRENVSSTANVNLPFKDDQSPLFAYVVWIFLPFLTYPVAPPYILSFGNEDTIFDPSVSIYHSFMPGVSHRSGTFMKFNVYPNHLNESLMEILSSTCFPMDQ